MEDHLAGALLDAHQGTTVGLIEQRLWQRDNLLRLSTVLAFVAVRLLQLREVVSDVPQAAELPCTRVLGDEEWKVLWASTVKRRPPTDAPSLAWAYRALAKLGGFLDTKQTGRAGWATLWDGCKAFASLGSWLMIRRSDQETAPGGGVGVRG